MYTGSEAHSTVEANLLNENTILTQESINAIQGSENLRQSKPQQLNYKTFIVRNSQVIKPRNADWNKEDVLDQMFKVKAQVKNQAEAVGVRMEAMGSQVLFILDNYEICFNAI